MCWSNDEISHIWCRRFHPAEIRLLDSPFNSSICNSAAGKRAMWAAWAPLLRSKVFLYFLHTNLNKQCLIRACFGKGYSWEALAIIFYSIQFERPFFLFLYGLDVSLYCNQNQSDSKAASEAPRSLTSLSFSLFRLPGPAPEELGPDSWPTAFPSSSTSPSLSSSKHHSGSAGAGGASSSSP